MEMRTLGSTGLKIAPLVLGGNVFGWTADRERSFAILDAFLDAGFNAIDTADVYNRFAPGLSGGESETILGEWMEDRGVRDRIVLITKGGLDMGTGTSGLGRDHLPKACEESLRRLRTDYIDVYMAHAADPDVPVGETLTILQELIDAGKVRHAGCSNYSAGQLKEAVAAGGDGKARYAVFQPHYNLLDRAHYEGETEQCCVANNMGVVTYYSLAAGFLSGKYRRPEDIVGHARARVLGGYANAEGFATVAAVEKTAQAHGVTPAQIAIAWVLARPSVSGAAASATTIPQLNELLRSVDVTLTAEDMAALDEAVGDFAKRAAP